MGEGSIEIYTLANAFVTFSRDEIADYGLITNSLMSEGLEKGLIDSDLKDLLSFLLER